MPLDWTAYDNFRWDDRRQARMSAPERLEVTDAAADVLELSREARADQ